ncbi:hypothetical protein GA0074692_5074 [Micromonospora pallida]|uniref:Uncharacterized protein n=1 Tax=Micromonospora pallida TaxID=145854 RepID=A0A1C6TAE7_9ACTN|nr:hypothetical protein [Micromonospora pallida]SCL38617.1 hypothetical protein GA0074692_5074 [Micromonospora pallida]
MTIDNDAASRFQGRTRRRLVPREQLAADYLTVYGSVAVAEYALAVRDVVEGCPGIGPVDTWRRLANRICRDNPYRNRDKWRRDLSRHFTTESKGPPWRTVVLVVEHTLPQPERAAALDRFADLHEAARGERPPMGEPPRPTGDDATATGQDTSGSAPLQRVLTRLRHENVMLRRQLAATRERLAASEAENGRLRAALDGPAHRGPGGGQPSDGSSRPSEQQRGIRNDGHFPPLVPPAGRTVPAGQRGAARPAAGHRPDIVTLGRPGTTGHEATWWVEGIWHRSDAEPAVGQPGRTQGVPGRFPAPATPGQPPATPGRPST